VKGILRRLGARNREALVEATGRALGVVGWLGHSGYDVAHHSIPKPL